MTLFLLMLAGLVLLFIGGEILIRGAVALAKNLNISPAIIGLTVVAYGTSSPELVVSAKAALDNFPDITLGNIIGSNISNILLVLGVAAAISPIAIDKKIAKFDSIFLLATTILLYVLCLNGKLDIISGMICLSILFLYSYLTFKFSRSSKDGLPEQQTEEIEEQITVKLNSWQASLACVAGIALLVFGADLLIDNAVIFATRIGISEAVIGLTLIAIGSSAPELVTSVVAAYHKHSDIALGNVVGSSIFNIIGIIGATSLVSEIAVSPQFINFDLIIMLATTLLLMITLLALKNLSRFLGILFLILYISYISYLVAM